MKDRKTFEGDEAYMAYCWSLKLDDWSDEEWQEYLEWRTRLLSYDTGDDVAHLVMAGTEKNLLTTKTLTMKKMKNKNPMYRSLVIFIDRMNSDPNSVRREWEAKLVEERGQEWVDENERYFAAWWDVVLMMHFGSDNVSAMRCKL